MTTELYHPPIEERKRNVQRLQTDVRELSHARTILDVAHKLVTMNQSMHAVAKSFGLELDWLRHSHSLRQTKRILSEVSGKDSEQLSAPMPGRAGYSSVKRAILSYAEGTGAFTVDDLLQNVPTLKRMSRRAIRANLSSLCRRADKPLRLVHSGKMGCKGTPAAFALRR